MRNRSRPFLNRERVALIIGVALLIASVSIVFVLIAQYPIRTTGEGTTTTTLNNSSALVLILSLNGTKLGAQQTLLINVGVNNSLGRLNNVSASNNWASGNLGQGFGPCGFTNSPIRLSVFKGTYSQANFSGATPLQMVNPSLIYSCPATFDIQSYAFQPLSNLANVSSCLGTPCINQYRTAHMNLSFSVNGTWSASNAQLEPFSPTTYTVVAGDEWGDVVLAYFLVTA